MSELVFIILFLSFLVHRINTNFFVILLQSSHIFSCFREFTFFHTLSNIPVDECTFGIHKIEFVIQTSPGFSNGSGIAQHAHSSLHLGQITTWNNSWWLVVDSNLETSRTPVHKLNGALGLDSGNGSIDILGDNISSEQQTASHVFAMARITFHHLVGWLKACIGDLRYCELLMVGLLS